MGPATDDDEVLKDLMRSGMDIARLNFSHGDHEEQLGRIKRIKKFREELNLPIAILLDTKGPEIRTGLLETDDDVELVTGQEYTLTTRDIKGNNEITSITYAELPQDVEAGNTILIDDGLIELNVKEIKDGTDIVCDVINGGLLGSRKGVNVPNVRVNLPSITEKDKADIEFGLENGIDFIAAFFICNAEAVNKIFQEYDIDRVVHFAAESHVDRSIKNPEIFVQTNVIGTTVLLNAARNAWEQEDGTYKEGKKFLHVSTDEVYGSLEEDGTFFYETTPYSPHSPYSASKASSDMLVKAYIDTYKFPANITNCSNNYGPYQFPEKLIPLIINNALNGKKIPVYGDGLNIRDWLYVEDHAKGIDMVQEKGRLGETYNIGGHNERRNIEIVKTILKLLYDVLPETDPRREHINENLIEYVEDRKGHDRRYAIAPDKIRKEVGWEPETDFETGIRKTIKWYLKNLDWMENITSGEYQNYYKEMYHL